MCASAPSLRVLFREYLSDTLSRLKRSVTSGRSRRDSDVEQVIVQRVDTPNEERHHQRIDFSAKHSQTPTCSDVSAKFSDPTPNVDAGLRVIREPQRQEVGKGVEEYNYDWSCQKSPTMLARASMMEREGHQQEVVGEAREASPPQQCIVKTPEDYESYNLQNMERYRASARESEEMVRTMSVGRGRASEEQQQREREEFPPSMRVTTGRSWLSLGR